MPTRPSTNKEMLLIITLIRFQKLLECFPVFHRFKYSQETCQEVRSNGALNIYIEKANNNYNNNENQSRYTDNQHNNSNFKDKDENNNRSKIGYDPCSSLKDIPIDCPLECREEIYNTKGLKVFSMQRTHICPHRAVNE